MLWSTDPTAVTYPKNHFQQEKAVCTAKFSTALSIIGNDINSLII